MFVKCDKCFRIIKNEKAAFKSQMSKNPADWNKVEKDRYNNFAEWQSDQYNNK